MLLLAFAGGFLACDRSDAKHPPAKTTDAEVAPSTLKPGVLAQAREKYLMLDAALEKLKKKAAETTDANELAALRDKQLAIELAVEDARKEIAAIEDLERTAPPQ